MSKLKPMQLRLPADLKQWISEQSKSNVSSQNSEVIRAVRERMERATARKAEIRKKP